MSDNEEYYSDEEEIEQKVKPKLVRGKKISHKDESEDEYSESSSDKEEYSDEEDYSDEEYDEKDNYKNDD